MIAVVYERVLAVPRALQIALASRRATAATVAAFLLLAVFYLMLLPATFTGGVVGLVSLRLLTPGYFVLGLLMAGLLALTLALAVQGFHNGARVGSAKSVLGALLALIPAMLCCSPILPLAVVAIASVLPVAGALGVPLQGFIATHEDAIYGIAVALMACGLYSNARRLLSCSYRSLADVSKRPTARENACCEERSRISL
ncbi:MAG: hypothetical protein ACREFP_20530 [Acetobacteraceae bacterium]